MVGLFKLEGRADGEELVGLDDKLMRKKVVMRKKVLTTKRVLIMMEVLMMKEKLS